MVSNSSFGLLAKTVALFLFAPSSPQRNILQKEKVLVLMWTESFFTVYQALDWEIFSDAEGTFSQLSVPVKKYICRTVELKARIMQSLTHIIKLPVASSWSTKSFYSDTGKMYVANLTRLLMLRVQPSIEEGLSTVCSRVKFKQKQTIVKYWQLNLTIVWFYR